MFFQFSAFEGLKSAELLSGKDHPPTQVLPPNSQRPEDSYLLLQPNRSGRVWKDFFFPCHFLALIESCVSSAPLSLLLTSSHLYHPHCYISSSRSPPWLSVADQLLPFLPSVSFYLLPDDKDRGMEGMERTSGTLYSGFILSKD